MPRSHLLLRRYIRPEKWFDTTEDVFDAVQQRDGRLITHQTSEDRSPDVSVHVYQDVQARDVMVSLVDDRALKQEYFVVQADSAAVIDQLADALAAALPIWTLAELRDAARQNMEREPTLLEKLALAAAPRFDSETRDVILAGLHSSRPEVRDAAAIAAGVLDWPQLDPEIRKLLATEPPGPVHELLKAALEHGHSTDG